MSLNFIWLILSLYSCSFVNSSSDSFANDSSDASLQEFAFNTKLSSEAGDCGAGELTLASFTFHQGLCPCPV